MVTPDCPLHSRPYRLAAMLLAALLVFASQSPAARPGSKNEALPKPPPQPVPASLRVKRGESLEIPLRIYGTRSQTLEFLIRSQPQNGRLSEIRPLGQEAAAVTYVPAREPGNGQDRFSYAVRSREGVSGAVDVLIAILDEPPELTVPPSVDFSRVVVGEMASEFLEISNRGGGTAQGSLEAEAPWQIEGPRTYKLAAGETRRIKIRFTPKSAGAVSGRLRFGGATERATELLGEGVLPVVFALNPARLTLRQSDAQSSRRGALLEILSQSARPQPITLSGDARLEFPRTLTLAPGERAAISVQTAPEDLQALELPIEMHSAAGDSTLQVSAASLEARLSFDREAVKFDPGTPARQSLVIENRGTAKVLAALEVSGAPFSLDSTTLEIAPSGKREISLHFESAKPGEFHGTLSVQAAAAHWDVPLTASVPGAAIASEPAPKAQAAAEPAAELPASRIQKAKVLDLDATSARLEWPNKTPGVTRFKVAWRSLAMENGELKIHWIESEPFTPRNRDGQWTETLTDLRPATTYAVRILGVGEPGSGQAPRFDAEFITKPAPPASRWRLALLVAALAGAAALGWRWRQRRRS